MKEMLDDLKEYFKNTPKDKIDKDMAELDDYNKYGPYMLDILDNK